MPITNTQAYEAAAKVNKEIVCDKCGFSHKQTEIDIKQEQLNVRGESLLLTYFTCKSCGELYKIALDSGETLNLKRQLRTTLQRVEKSKQKRDMTAYYKHVERAEKQQKLLTKKVKALNGKYPGKFYQKVQP